MQKNRETYIWIEDAVREYGRSRAWLNEQIATGNLTRHGAQGDRRIYLSREELDRLTIIKPIRAESA